MFKRKHLATITILVKDRKSHAADVNKALSDFGDHIIARLGVNAERAKLKHTSALICIVVEASVVDIKKITKTLDELYGIEAKASIMTE